MLLILSFHLSAANRDFESSSEYCHYCFEHRRQSFSNDSLFLVELDFFPTRQIRCEYSYCSRCNSQIRPEFHYYILGYDITEENRITGHYPYAYRICLCYHREGMTYYAFEGVHDSWSRCSEKAVYQGYFYPYAERYLPFVNEYLGFLKSEGFPKDLWPELNPVAMDINDQAYDLFSDLLVQTKLGDFFNSEDNKEIFFNKPYLNKHGLCVQFVACSFFYSHYHRICNELEELASKNLELSDYLVIRDKLFDIKVQLAVPFQALYEELLGKNESLTIFQELQFMNLYFGDSLIQKSYELELKDLANQKFKKSHNSSWALKPIYNKEGRDKELEQGFVPNDKFEKAFSLGHNSYDWTLSSVFLIEGVTLSEFLMYDEAIELFDKALKLNSENPDIFFEKAFTNFELGNFESAIENYKKGRQLSFSLLDLKPVRASDKFEKIGFIHTNYSNIDQVAFSKGLVVGTKNGIIESGKKFVPSTLGTISGIGQGLWTFAKSPILVTKEMYASVLEVIDIVREYPFTDALRDVVVPELLKLAEQWDQLDDYKKGELTGYVIGKYGTDIFLGIKTIQGVNYLRNLRKANAMMTLEATAVSAGNKATILEEATKKAALRKTLFEEGKIKIHWDKQRKHIPGAHNYQKGKSIITISEERLEQLVKEKAGIGIKGRNSPIKFGDAGYREYVNFEETIGIYIQKGEKVGVETTNGAIHYDKNGGIHVVPSKPGNLMEIS